MSDEQILFDDNRMYAGNLDEPQPPYFDQPQEISPASILALFDTTRDQRSSFAMQLIQDMQEGRRNPLDVHLQIKSMQSVIDLLTDKKASPTIASTYNKLVLEEAEKNGKEFEYHNSKITIKEVGTVYDWSKCNDADLDLKMKQVKNLEREIKDMQAFLKTVPKKGKGFVDEETGEAYTLYPPAKSSTTAVSVQLS